MRQQATLSEWRQLYDLGLRFKTMKPWEQFGNAEIISIRFGEDEVGYFSISGMDGGEPWATLYIGESGLNDFMGMIMADQLDIDIDYMIKEQNCMEMNFGDRDEVTDEQYDIIKALGLKFRGNGNWLYFDLYKKGCLPILPDREKVREYTRYLEALLEAMEYYKNNQVKVDYSKLDIYEYGKNEQGEWVGKSVPLPTFGYQYHGIDIEDELERARLKKASKNKIRKGEPGYIVEMDMFYLDETVELPEYDTPVYPKTGVMIDYATGKVMKHYESFPQERNGGMLAAMLCELIKNYGTPHKVMVANHIMEAGVQFICEMCGIALEVCELENMEELKESMLDSEIPQLTEEEMEFLTGMLESMGVDIEDLRNKAQYMDEEEFLEELSEQMLGGLGLDDEDESDPWFDLSIEKPLKNRKQKM